MDYDKHLAKSKENFDELEQMKKDIEPMESTMMKPKMRQIDLDMQDIDGTNRYSESEIPNETNFIASKQNNQIISLCQNLVDILSDKEAIARFRLEEPDILETAIKFAENILKGEQKVIFKGNDEIKRAKYLFLEYLNYVIPTIEQPLAQITKQDGRIVYVKAFTYDGIKGDRPLKYMVVTKDEQGTINLVTSFSSQKIKDVIKIFNEAKEVQINIVPNDTFALSRGGTELKQSSTDETITDNTLNKAESKKNFLKVSPTGFAPAIPPTINGVAATSLQASSDTPNETIPQNSSECQKQDDLNDESNENISRKRRI